MQPFSFMAAEGRTFLAAFPVGRGLLAICLSSFAAAAAVTVVRCNNMCNADGGGGGGYGGAIEIKEIFIDYSCMLEYNILACAFFFVARMNDLTSAF